MLPLSRDMGGNKMAKQKWKPQKKIRGMRVTVSKGQPEEQVVSVEKDPCFVKGIKYFRRKDTGELIRADSCSRMSKNLPPQRKKKTPIEYMEIEIIIGYVWYQDMVGMRFIVNKEGKVLYGDIFPTNQVKGDIRGVRSDHFHVINENWIEEVTHGK